ncbi:2Fe-2S iron-sulfur cluster binding domain-containing protein [Brachybacterium paraconglomeratum]|uniref:2Fe-2S iron-sulfur cluster-binding protein n=1 Tax=Brachybacterium paraconglomeratum TaxID=173362 RepID=UPI0031EF99AE
MEDWDLHESAPQHGVVDAEGAMMSLFGEPFTAKCLKSGITLEVGEDQSLLQVLLDADIPMDYSCEGGVCGTCVVPLVSGEVEHLDEYLMDDEHADQMITCVSRGEGEIVIDI